MLGPSGSGKTTCLRMIAGFDRPTPGSIFLYGQDVSDLPPVRARRQYGVSGLCVVPAHDHWRQYCLWLDDQESCRKRSARSRWMRCSTSCDCRDLEIANPPSSPADSAAGRACPGLDQPSQGALARRAAGRAGPQTAPADAGGAQVDPEAGGHHVHLRHARSGGSVDDE